jgi:hypothetical protein
VGYAVHADYERAQHVVFGKQAALTNKEIERRRGGSRITSGVLLAYTSAPASPPSQDNAGHTCT